MRRGGEGGRDVIIGGFGNDSIRGGSSADKILGQGGNDLIWGDGGAATLQTLITGSQDIAIGVGALAALKSADRASLDLVAVYGGGRLKQLVKVQLISALPGILNALKIAVPAAYTRVVDRAIQVWGAAGVSNDLPLAGMYLGARTLVMTGLAADSRHVRPGDLFRWSPHAAPAAAFSRPGARPAG